MADQNHDEGYKGLGLGSHTGTTDGVTQGEVTSARGIGITDTGTTGAEPIIRDVENLRGGRGIASTSGPLRSGSTIASVGIAGTNVVGMAPEDDSIMTSDQAARSSDDFGEEAGAPHPMGHKVADYVPEVAGMGGTSDSETAAEDAWSDAPSPRPDDKISGDDVR